MGRCVVGQGCWSADREEFGPIIKVPALPLLNREKKRSGKRKKRMQGQPIDLQDKERGSRGKPRKEGKHTREPRPSERESTRGELRKKGKADTA